MVVRVIRLYKKKKQLPNMDFVIPGLKFDLHANDVIKIIFKKFRFDNFWRWLINRARIYIADEWYHVVSKDDLKYVNQFCKEINDKAHYVVDIFDCDDFTNALSGQISILRYMIGKNLAFGKIWFCSEKYGYCHATTFFIDERKQFVWYEPQRCGYMNFDEHKPTVLLIVI